jgi:hypothetical protein
MSTQTTLPAATRATVAELRTVLDSIDAALQRSGRNGSPPPTVPLAEVLVATSRFTCRLSKLALAAGLAEKKAASNPGQPELFEQQPQR